MYSLEGSTVLITGGTGTFGLAFLRYCLDNKVKEVRIFSRNKSKQDLLKQKFPRENRIKFYIGDVSQRKDIDKAMSKVDYVVHAAAIKRIPECEQFPERAFLTNVVGSENVIESAIFHNVAVVVCISTDKAVNPISTMGVTKANMEKNALQKAKEQNSTKICIARFCNLFISSGSVVPLFIQQAKNNMPLTLTDPDMSRFFITLDQAIDLVLKAIFIASNGDILLQKANGCFIKDIAKAVLFYLDKDKDYPIKITGARPGDKKYELLLTQQDFKSSIDYEDYIVLSAKDEYKRDGNFEPIYSYSNPLSVEHIIQMLQENYQGEN